MLHRPLVVRICFGYLRNRADADDAAQETFARVVAHRDRVSDDLAAYMRVTARNVCRDLLRRREVERRNAEGLRAGHAGDPEDVVLDQREIAAVLPRMSGNDLRLVALRFAGFSYDEIAERLGTSMKCVSVGLTRARQRARQLASTAPAHLGALFGLVSPWRHHGRMGSMLEARNSVLVTQCLSIATGIALLGAPAAATAGHDGQGGRGRPLAGIAPGISSIPGRTAHVVGTDSGGTLLDNSATGRGTAPATADGLTQRSASAPPVVPNSRIALQPTPQSTAFFSVAPSPDYAQNHTAYAQGYSGSCACIVLFVTHDAGRSWHLLPPVTMWTGWTPNWLDVFEPGDRVLAFTPGLGLQVTTPGGLAFSETIPAAHAVHVPGTSAVLLAFATGTALERLDLDTMSLSPGPSLPPGFGVDEMAYAGTPRSLVVAGHVSSAVDWAQEQVSPFFAGPGHEIVLGCSQTACSQWATLPYAAGQVSFSTPADAASPQIAVSSSSSSGALLSTDGGRSWNAPQGAPANASVLTFLDRTGTPPDLLLTTWTPSGNPALEFHGAGAAPTAFGGAFFTSRYLYLVTQLPDGRLLASFGGGPYGLWCSTDGGNSWSPTCP